MRTKKSGSSHDHCQELYNAAFAPGSAELKYLCLQRGNDGTNKVENHAGGTDYFPEAIPLFANDEAYHRITKHCQSLLSQPSKADRLNAVLGGDSTSDAVASSKKFFFGIKEGCDARVRQRFAELVRRVWEKAHSVRKTVRRSTYRAEDDRNWQLWMFYHRFIKDTLRRCVIQAPTLDKDQWHNADKYPMIRYLLPSPTIKDENLTATLAKLHEDPKNEARECAAVEFYELYLQSALVPVYKGQMIYFKLDCIKVDSNTSALDQERDMLLASNGGSSTAPLSAWRGAIVTKTKRIKTGPIHLGTEPQNFDDSDNPIGVGTVDVPEEVYCKKLFSNDDWFKLTLKIDSVADYKENIMFDRPKVFRDGEATDPQRQEGIKIATGFSIPKIKNFTTNFSERTAADDTLAALQKGPGEAGNTNLEVAVESQLYLHAMDVFDYMYDGRHFDCSNSGQAGLRQKFITDKSAYPLGIEADFKENDLVRASRALIAANPSFVKTNNLTTFKLRSDIEKTWSKDTEAYKTVLMYLANCPMAQMVSADRMINTQGRFTVVQMGGGGGGQLSGGGDKPAIRQVEKLGTPLEHPYVFEHGEASATSSEPSERGYTSIFGDDGSSTRYMELLD